MTLESREIEPFRGTDRIMVEVEPWKARCQVFGCPHEAIWRCDNGFNLCRKHARHFHLADGLMRVRAKLTRLEGPLEPRKGP